MFMADIKRYNWGYYVILCLGNCWTNSSAPRHSGTYFMESHIYCHLCRLQTGMALILPFQALCLVHLFPFFSPLHLSCLIAPENAYSTMLNLSHEFSTVLLFLLLAKKFLVLTYGLNVPSKVQGWQNEFKNMTQPYVFYQKSTSL